MTFKKIAFAPVFLILFAFFSYQLALVLNLPNLAFSLDLSVAIATIILTAAIILSSVFFVIFAALANDWRITLGVSIAAASLPMIFLPAPVSFVTAVLSFLILVGINYFLSSKLKTYIDFHPVNLFLPDIKTLIFFLILITAIGYFLLSYADIQKNGFQLPDSLIDLSLKFSPQPEASQADQQSLLSNISPEQIAQLKQNPQLLKQYGLDASMLDAITNPSKSTGIVQSPIKQLIKKQFQSIIEPYIKFVPWILALLFYFSIQFFSSILSMFITPIIMLIFYILEKSGFITFTTEMREVKKMVV